MKLQIIDYNKGQLPTTIKEAVSYAPCCRKTIEKYLDENRRYEAVYDVSYKGYCFGIAEKMED